MMRPFSLVLAISLVLATSGCTTPSGGSGVEIEEFTTGGLSEVYPGEPITFMLKVRNTGSVEAREVFAEVLGLDEDWGAASSVLPDNRDKGLYVGGEILPQEPLCRYSSADHFTLLPPDPVQGTVGETATCTWLYRAPDVPEGMNPTYPVTARVFYAYRTDAVKSFTILPTSEMVKYNQQGRSVPVETVSTTSSPISISTESRNPIRFWEDSISFPLAITVSNSGGGMACQRGRCKKSSSGGHAWDKVSLRLIPMSQGTGVSSECQRFMGTGESAQSLIDVWPNRDNTVTCEIEITGLSQVRGQEERLLGISAEYGYFTDAGTTITLL